MRPRRRCWPRSRLDLATTCVRGSYWRCRVSSASGGATRQPQRCTPPASTSVNLVEVRRFPVLRHVNRQRRRSRPSPRSRASLVGMGPRAAIAPRRHASTVAGNSATRMPAPSSAIRTRPPAMPSCCGPTRTRRSWSKPSTSVEKRRRSTTYFDRDRAIHPAMTTPRPDPRLGTDLGPYRIEAVIGRGGMGVVYLRHRSRTSVAAWRSSCFREELADDADFRARFMRESKMAAAIDDPNILPVYDAGEVDGVLFIAMRYVEGSDLEQRLRAGALTAGRRHPPPWPGGQRARQLPTPRPRPPRRQAGQHPHRRGSG